MSDRDAHISPAFDAFQSAESEAARVQDFADAVRHALESTQANPDGVKPGVRDELESALSALSAWMQSDRNGDPVVALFSEKQPRVLKDQEQPDDSSPVSRED